LTTRANSKKQISILTSVIRLILIINSIWSLGYRVTSQTNRSLIELHELIYIYIYIWSLPTWCIFPTSHCHGFSHGNTGMVKQKATSNFHYYSDMLLLNGGLNLTLPRQHQWPGNSGNCLLLSVLPYLYCKASDASSIGACIMWYQEHLHLGDVLLLPLSFCSVNSL